MRVMFIGGPLDNTIRDIGRIGDDRRPYEVALPREPLMYQWPTSVLTPGFETVTYFPQVVSNAVGQTITLYAIQGSFPEVAHEHARYRQTAIECYGAEFFEEWHSVTFWFPNRHMFHRGHINSSHTKFAVETHRHPGTSFNGPFEDLVIDLGGKDVRFAVTSREGRGRGNMAVFNIRELLPQKVSVKAKTYKDHPEYRNFIRSICATPADDMPRLMFADWLDEQGDTEASARSEFIRLQIELANGPHVYDKRYHHLRQRTEELCRSEWFDCPLALECKGSSIPCCVRRGFVSGIRCTLAQFERHAGRIALEHPVTSWVLTDREPMYYGDDRGYWWIGRTAQSLPLPFDLPIGLYTALDGGWSTAIAAAKRYSTSEAAVESLQRACYVVARQRAEELERMDDLGITQDDIDANHYPSLMSLVNN